MLHQYILDLSIFTKDKYLEREGDITGLLEDNVKLGCLMKSYASREAFGFARDVIGSTRRRTSIDKLDVIVLKRIMTPSFISLDMFYF